ncbi:iduronate-2-sulfatase [Echinicola strongylocentroti]|uniref:Iduronate-2-sulfatase n=1 Tax=Echinicola strongylocentroti TaxID=1795355 RepID=A0A2Z4IPZ5_9BACT|nr:sulfatase [Echinicola strongylocentroti]AWW32779.1 iduronate-2-sulfatase [Echinicola strongylocentroti]
MKKYCIWFLLLILTISCGPEKEHKKNVLLICIDDLRPELNSFGATYIKSPHIDKLAADGRAFHRHFVNAPSCGPSRYTLLTGQYGLQYRRHYNQPLFSRAAEFQKDAVLGDASMPAWFRQNGYTTVSVGKVSHHPGGRGGENWDNDSIPEMPSAWDRHLMPVGDWKTPRGAMHGLAYGKVREPNQRDVIESVDGGDDSYPDGLIAEEGLRQLEDLAAADKPFFLAIGLIKPHLPFGVPKEYLDYYEGVDIPPIPHPEKPNGKTTWHGSKEFMNYNRWGKDPRKDAEFAMTLKKYYAACVSYADKHVGDILDKLKETGQDQNTIVVVWGDHGWHLGEHAIWGKHSLFEESLHSPLIIFDPAMSQKGKSTNALVETLDVFPTLCDLTQIGKPEYLQGISLLPFMKDPSSKGHSALAYSSGATTIRTDRYRFTQDASGNMELYDHMADEYEIQNVAMENPVMVEKLKKLIIDKAGEIAFVWDP